MENLRGILFMVLAMGLFALEDAAIKAASAYVSTGQILLFLGTTGTVLFWLLAWRKGVAVLTRDLWLRPIVIRNLAEVVGTITFISALAHIPLATAGAIVQATPIMMTLGAALLLGETVGWRRWSAILVGFAGVLMILRPGMESFDPNALLAVIAVIMLAARDLAARYLPARIGTLQLSVYGFASAIVGGLILLPFSLPMAAPTALGIGFLLAVTLLGMAAYFVVTIATRTGEVSVVTPFRYSRLIFAMALGIALFGERPDVWTLLGAALVVAAGLYTLIRETRLRRSSGGGARAPKDAKT